MAYVPGNIVFPTESNDSGTATVTKAYQIGETEIVWELWTAVRTWAVTTKTGEKYSIATGSNGSSISGGASAMEPVTEISWRDAAVWCNALTEWYNEKAGKNLAPVYQSGGQIIRNAGSGDILDAVSPVEGATGFRLPGSYEWELAARWQGTTSQNSNSLLSNGYYFTKGNSASGATADTTDIPATNLVAWTSDSYFSGNVAKTQPVKGKSPNTLGLYDMSGNVYEWCFEKYLRYSETSTNRVVRGGSWVQNAGIAQIGRVGGFMPTYIDRDTGFRVAKTAE
jgi:formylglycine-generating enzyme required for sulfatase activity